MKKFDNKKHDERFFNFKKGLIRNGAYFNFIDELCRFGQPHPPKGRCLS